MQRPQQSQPHPLRFCMVERPQAHRARNARGSGGPTYPPAACIPATDVSGQGAQLCYNVKNNRYEATGYGALNSGSCGTESGVLKGGQLSQPQMDVTLLDEIGREFRRRFDGAAITKIVTIEASGIGIAAIARSISAAFPSSSPKRRVREIWTVRCIPPRSVLSPGHYLRCAAIKNFSARRTLCSSWTISSPEAGTAGPHRHRAAGRARSALAAASSLKSSSRAAARWCGQRECAWIAGRNRLMENSTMVLLYH